MTGMDVHLSELAPDDGAGVASYVDIVEAGRLADSPWWPPLTVRSQSVLMRHGFDGEPGRHFLVVAGPRSEPAAAVGVLALHTNTYDNLDLAWIEMGIHPGHRRHGYGTAAMELGRELARASACTKLCWFGWDTAQTAGFATSLGLSPKSVAVARRQLVQELEPGLADRVYDEALPYAGAYEVVRIAGAVPEELLPSFVEATGAINDAPMDALVIEDEVFSGERVRAFEEAQRAGGNRLYRVVARHRETGEVAGLSAVSVDGELDYHAHQLDTSVVRAHRGHRLGQLLKADMVRWLAEAEPQLESVDTFNAESNDHMIAVNDRLGYRVLSRELQYQDEL
jgi:RimJ/RimL family protein N-acetyltransferase